MKVNKLSNINNRNNLHLIVKNRKIEKELSLRKAQTLDIKNIQ